MSLEQFLVLLLVAAIIGALGEALAGYSLGGCAASVIVGFIGALIGSYLRDLLNMPRFLSVTAGGRQIDIIWSVIGAAVFVLLMSFIRRRRAVV